MAYVKAVVLSRCRDDCARPKRLQASLAISARGDALAALCQRLVRAAPALHRPLLDKLHGRANGWPAPTESKASSLQREVARTWTACCVDIRKFASALAEQRPGGETAASYEALCEMGAARSDADDPTAVFGVVPPSLLPEDVAGGASRETEVRVDAQSRGNDVEDASSDVDARRDE